MDTCVISGLAYKKVLYKHGKMHSKLQYKEKSPRRLVETQMVGPTLKFLAPTRSGEGCVRVIVCISNFPRDINASLGIIL